MNNYDLKLILPNGTTISQTAKAENPKDAIQQIFFAIDEEEKEFIIVCRRREEPAFV